MIGFDDLYAKHAADVFRYALRCVGRRDVAEDITADVFLVLHRNLAGIDASRLPGWLFVVAKNRAIDYWRRMDVEQRYTETLPPAATTWAPSLEFWLTRMKALKPVHRACLILRYVHGQERAEIARQLSLTENQVKGHLQYTLTILRRDDPDEWASLFRRREDEPPACPDPELVQAARAGVLTPLAQEAVTAHIAGCVVCAALGDSLDDLPVGPTAEESKRILQRIHAELPGARRRRSRAGWWWLAGAAAASMAIIAFWQGGAPASIGGDARTENEGARQPSSVFDIGHPPILRPMTAQPGSAATDLEAGELAAALVPYRAGDFDLATARLSAFVARYPRNAEGQFYLGLSELVRPSAVTAVAALETAERLGADDADLLREIQWYLAVAYLHAGQRARAWEEFAELCRSPRRRSPKACLALRELAPSMRLEGIVTDVAGRPIAGAVVAEHTGQVMPKYLVTSRTRFAATTGSNGRYRVDGASASLGATVLVRASAPGFFTSSAQVPFAADTVADFKLLPWRLIAVGETVSASTADDPAACPADEPCQLFAVTVGAAGTFEVSVTSGVRHGMDVYVEVPSGEVYGPRLEAPLALELPAAAGATFQIRVMSFDGPRAFQLTTRLR